MQKVNAITVNYYREYRSYYFVIFFLDDRLLLRILR